jgi:hypothetical protein
MHQFTRVSRHVVCWEYAFFGPEPICLDSVAESMKNSGVPRSIWNPDYMLNHLAKGSMMQCVDYEKLELDKVPNFRYLLFDIHELQ